MRKAKVFHSAHKEKGQSTQIHKTNPTQSGRVGMDELFDKSQRLRNKRLMARKTRIEFPGAYYHVINRGNYRSWIFESEGARKSFFNCLCNVCVAQRWRLHGWVLMSNHYHLCLETPEANLVEGMTWLQSTFANRFNRYRKENGHVFQGRYKAILLDERAIGPVCHYINLNPVRAGLVAVSQLESFQASGFHQLWYLRKRWPFFVATTALEGAGGLPDSPRGRCRYRDYLESLSEDDVERKRLGFDKMCRGWAKGGADFKKTILDELKENISVRVVESEAAELREPLWERKLQEGLAALGKVDQDLFLSRKGVDWKVALARHLRERALIPNGWIAKRLVMGSAKSVSSRISQHRRLPGYQDELWKMLTLLECED